MKPHEIGRHILDTRQIAPKASEAALQNVEREKVSKEARENVINLGADALQDAVALSSKEAAEGAEAVLRAVGVLE